MNKIKTPLLILIAILLFIIGFLFSSTRSNQLEEIKKTKITLSKENPLLKQMNIKDAEKPEANQNENKSVEVKELVADVMKSEIHNEEFDAKLDLEANKGNVRRLYIEVTPKQKELSDEEIYKRQGQFVLNKIIIEQNLNEAESIQNNINLTIPAKVFYSVDDVRKRIIANADFIYKKGSALGILVINANKDKAIEAENKIFFEKSENTGAKLTFKTTFKLIPSTNALTENGI